MMMGHAARLLVTALLLLLSGSISLAASAQCELKPGVKLGADKVGDKNGTSSATAAACCTLCQANTKCIVFAWDKDKHICDIFDKMGDSKATANYVSGLAHAAPPGPPVLRSGETVEEARACAPQIMWGNKYKKQKCVTSYT